MALTKTRKIGKILNGNLKFSVVLDSDRIDSSSTKGINITPTTLVVATTDDLPATSFNGKKALVTSTNSSYMYSNGWYKLNTSNKFSPYWITEPDSEYTLDLTSIDSDVKIVVLAFDSDDVPITYTAVVDSDFNVSATISHDSDKDNVWIVRRRDSDSGAGTTGSVTFKASDGVNLTQKVVAFITSANTTYEFLGTVESVYSGTVLNLDSDMESLISAGDVLTNAAGGGSEATVSSVSFLNDTYAARTDLGTIVATGAGDQGTGFFGLNQDGTFNSNYYGTVASLGSSSANAQSRYRSGNTIGGAIITSHTNQSYSNTSVSTYSSGNGAFSNNWAFFGFIPNDYEYGGMLYNSNGWSSSLGTALPTNVALTTNSNGTSAVTNSNAAITTYQGRATKTHNPAQRSSGFWTYLGAVITYWSGRYNYMEYLNQSNTTYFRCQYDRTSYFTAGALLFSASSFPTERQITECDHLVVHSSSYNSGTNETTVYCGNQFNRSIRTLYDGGNLTNYTFSTGSVSPARTINFWKSTNPQPVHYYKHTSTTNNSGMDIEYGDTVAGNYISGVETLTLYQSTTSTVNYYKVATNPSPGNTQNIALGTSWPGSNMYSWKNVTSAVVDDTTGFTAGDNIYKKIG